MKQFQISTFPHTKGLARPRAPKIQNWFLFLLQCMVSKACANTSRLVLSFIVLMLKVALGFFVKILFYKPLILFLRNLLLSLRFLFFLYQWPICRRILSLYVLRMSFCTFSTSLSYIRCLFRTSSSYMSCFKASSTLHSCFGVYFAKEVSPISFFWYW